MLTIEQINKLKESKDERIQALLAEYLSNPLWSFEPRPDKPELLDQQSSYLNDKFKGLAVALGGNRSGKTMVSAVKAATLLLSTPPPQPDTPFWIVGRTLDMACGVCWKQHLRHYLPNEYIARNKSGKQPAIEWFSEKMGMPAGVRLKPHANGNNWILEFKSAEQDREKFQGAAIGGAWIDEFCPTNILVEIWARMSNYSIPGNFFYSLTPLTYDAELEDKFNNQEKFKNSWKFYRLNSACNTTLAEGQLDMVLENELAELRETRLTGAFVHLYGAVYKSFNPLIHVVDPFPIPDHWYRIRGLDLGFNHPTCCLWIAKDDEGCYYVYNEYHQAGEYVSDHVDAINQTPWRYDLPHTYGPTYVDPHNKQVVAEFDKLGLQTTPADKKDVKVGITTVSSFLQGSNPKLKIFKNCENLIKGIRTYQWHAFLDKPLKEHDDAVDALRYAIHTDSQSLQRWEPLRLPAKNGNLVRF